jgi:hypothetical protein
MSPANNKCRAPGTIVLSNDEALPRRLRKRNRGVRDEGEDRPDP